MPGTDSGICSDENYFGGNNLAHEMGHRCGLVHNNANVDNVMLCMRVQLVMKPY